MKTDEELMSDYRAGDRHAFRALFDRYAPLLQRIVSRDMNRPEEARDIVQQTFLQLHRARADFRADGRFRPWVVTIAMNLKRQYFRQWKRRGAVTDDLEGGREPVSEAEDPSAAALAQQVRAALLELPEDQRDAIVLHWFEGFSFPEVAEIVGAKTSAVKVRAHRGYERLREILGRDPVTADTASAYTDRNLDRGA